MELLRSKKVNYLLLLLSGALTALPLVFPKLGIFQWFSMIPMAVVLLGSSQEREPKLKGFYTKGLIYFWCYYAVTFHWFFYMYPLDFAGLSNAASIAVVVVACVGLSLFQALWSALAFLLFAFITRSESIKSAWVLKPLIAAALWVAAEWWQTVGWWGVPWGRMPLGQMNSLLFVRSSSLFGSYFVTFIIVAVNFFVASAVMNETHRRTAISLALTMFSINLALGTLTTVCGQANGDTVRAAAVQGNISSSEKWDSDSLDKTLEVYKRLTEEAAAEGAEVAVWPETAIPYVLEESVELSKFVSSLAEDNNITIIVSAFSYDQESGLRYNSMIEARPDGSFGERVYSKQHLVPFGEFVPMRELVMLLIPPLADIGMLDADLLAGDGSVVMGSEIGKIGCGICFDSIYEGVVLGSVRDGAQVIAIATNDSWFSDSAALSMHNSQSRLRAIESGRYVVRAANTGISSIIDPLGNIDGELGANKEGYVVSEITLSEGRTMYSYIGNLFVYMCIASLCALAMAGLCGKRLKMKKNKIDVNVTEM